MAERLLLAATRSWSPVDLTELPRADRRTRATFIRELCIGPGGKGVDPRGLWLRGALVVGELDLSYCEIAFPLRFVNVEFDSAVNLDRCRFPGIDFERSGLPGCSAASAHVAFSLSFECSEVGWLRLLDAHIGGDLNLLNTSVTSGVDGCALAATGAEIGGTLWLRGADIREQVRLVGSSIGGSLLCEEATLGEEPPAPGSVVLVANGAKVALEARFTDATITGEMMLVGANVGQDAYLDGTRVVVTGGDAMTLDGATVGGDLVLGPSDAARRFIATGAVRGVGASIGNSLRMDGASLGDGRRALVLDGTKVGASLLMHTVDLCGAVRLFHLSTTVLDDDVGDPDRLLGSWGGAADIDLRSFTYAQFADDSVPPATRFDWLAKPSTFDSGSWEHLIGVYRNLGRENDARDAAIAKEEDRYQRMPRGLRKVGRWSLGVAIGHGYRPWRAAIWASIVIAFFAIVVARSPEAFIPADNAPGRSPNPLVYSVDTFLPIVDFGEADRWAPSGVVEDVEWVVIALGWILTTIVVAGFSQVVRTE